MWILIHQTKDDFILVHGITNFEFWNILIFLQIWPTKVKELETQYFIAVIVIVVIRIIIIVIIVMDIVIVIIIII